MKNVVDRVLPCGMPSVMSSGFDIALSVCSVCILLVKYDVRNDIVWASKLNVCCSLWSSFWCEMVSYALERSR